LSKLEEVRHCESLKQSGNAARVVAPLYKSKETFLEVSEGLNLSSLLAQNSCAIKYKEMVWKYTVSNS